MGSYFKSNQRKLVSALAAAIFVVIVTGFCSVPKAFAKYSGGTGEPNEPYRIATPQDLNDIGNYEEDWDKHFVLVNDVNLAQYSGTQFKIIGRWIPGYPNNKPFTGIFEGNDKIIWNFTWRTTNQWYIGLFRYVGNGSQIKNLALQNINVNATTGQFVGGLVGYNKGTISNCHVTGNVLGNYWDFGGLVGLNYGTIRDCRSACSVSGESNVGGLVATNSGGTITNCYSTGNVSGNGYVGGLVGWNDRHAEITNCYSTGSVSGTSRVGGLVGENYYGTITNCYATGSILGTSYVGGLAGGDGGVVVNSFWDTQTSGQLTSAGGIGKTTAEMKTMSTFTDAGWDFVDVWGVGEYQTYPYLKTTPAGDSNLDNIVDLADLAILASHWLARQPF